MSGYHALPAETCKDCKYFRRHYIRIYEDEYLPLDYGHCVYPRLKSEERRSTAPIGCPPNQKTDKLKIKTLSETQFRGSSSFWFFFFQEKERPPGEGI